MDFLFVIECVIITLIGLAGNCLFKIGTDKFQQKISFNTFFQREFLQKTLFTWAGWTIFASLILNFTSRIMLMIPFSKERFGIVWSLMIPLGLTATVLAGIFVFKETYSIREIAGIVLTIVAVFLLSYGGKA